MNTKGNPKIAEHGRATQFAAGCQRVVELAKQAGEASVRAKEKQRSRREWSLLIGSLPVDVLKDKPKIASLVELMEAAGVGTEDQCWDAVEIARMHREAMEGNVAAFREVGNLNGDIQRNVSLEVAPRKDAKDLLTMLKDGGRL